MDKIIISRRLLCSTREMFNFAVAKVSPVTDDDDESDISGSSLIYALSDSADEDGVVQFESDESDQTRTTLI